MLMKLLKALIPDPPEIEEKLPPNVTRGNFGKKKTITKPTKEVTEKENEVLWRNN